MLTIEAKSSTSGFTASNTFTVSKVSVTTEKVKELPYKEAIEKALGDGKPIESCPAKLTSSLVPTEFHGFVSTLHQCFMSHRPLSFGPDHVWLMICQGVANHINQNSDTLRKQLVAHEGKATIIVQRNKFIRGAMENDWENVWPEFLEKMAEHVGPSMALMFTPAFTTTGVIERAACQIAFMDAMQSYFNYEVYTKCGIPIITLEGTPADWQQIKARVSTFRSLGLDSWLDMLMPVLEQFVQTSQCNADPDFWQSFYKWGSGSGEEWISGHILKFFPYRMETTFGEIGEYKGYDEYLAKREAVRKKKMVPNEEMGKTYRYGGGMQAKDFPVGLSSAPFIWDYYGNRLDYEFLAGFVGATQKDDMTLRPEIGWAVRPK